MRLKEKLGNRSNASAEIEYHGAYATLVGEEGRGVPTILAMVHHTRLDTMASTLGIMRMGLAQAAHHAAHRQVFGKTLIDQPTMRSVLADLQLDYEAAVALTCRVARALDGADENERSLARLGVAIGKFWLTKRVSGFIMECMECLGGGGYVEEGPMPRLYREAPVNAIWEGSGNVIALDVLRTLSRDRQAGAAMLHELGRAKGANRHFDAAADGLANRLAVGEIEEHYARKITEDIAVTLAAALLIRYAPPAVSEAYCATRLGGEGGHGYGILTNGDVTRIVGRIGIVS
jgi:putative acyl-CoA dehydrogenase